MEVLTLYHNPRCSKSREALALLDAHGRQPEIVLYLENPPDATTLRGLVARLGIAPRDLLRTREPEYRAQNLDDPLLDDDAVIAAIAANPRLLERPIAVHGDRAVIGRPPEKVLELL